MLQVGTRYYRLVIRINEKNPLEIGEVIDVAYIGRQLNMLIKCPIFSIDYINVDGKMLAVDFNTVECLEKLNIQSLLSKEKIVSDIYTIISSDYIK